MVHFNKYVEDIDSGMSGEFVFWTDGHLGEVASMAPEEEFIIDEDFASDDLIAYFIGDGM